MDCFDNKDERAIRVIKEHITPQDVLMVAQQFTADSSVKILQFEINAYSSKILGGLGSHWHLEINIQRTNSSTDTLNFFVKSFPVNCQQLLTDFMNNEHVFEEESTFFEKIYPFLTESYTGEKWSPKSYLVKTNVIIMEDLRFQGFKIKGKFFDDTLLLKAALATIARFHSCSILAEAKLKQLQTIHKTLDKYFPDSFREKAYSRSGYAKGWHDSSINVVAAIAENLNLQSNILRKAFEKVYDIVKPSPKHHNVICHGDLWTNNLMFDDTKPIPKCILVDFQCIRYAPLVLDLLKLLYLNSTRDYRIKNEKNLIKYYYSVLIETLRNNNTIDLISVPTLEEIIESFEKLRLFGAIAACLYLPLHLINSEVVKEYFANDSGGFENFVNGDRVGVTFAGMKKSEWFKNKIEEVVIEFSDVVKTYDMKA